MNAPFFALLALDLARERAAEANAQRLAHRSQALDLRPSRVRRVVARVALAVARAADSEIVNAPLATR
jgi:hypothetical protein